MKNLIMGIAIMLLATTFLVYQDDVNLMQLKQAEVYEAAQEAANAAALELNWGTDSDDDTDLDYSNGFIAFDDPYAGEWGTICAQYNLGIYDEKPVGFKEYFKEPPTIIMYTFSQDLSYTKYVDGEVSDTGYYQPGDNICDYVESPYSEMLANQPEPYQVTINHPSTVCIIDAGHPKYRLDAMQNFIHEADIRICRMGMYEYKEYDWDDWDGEGGEENGEGEEGE